MYTIKIMNPEFEGDGVMVDPAAQEPPPTVYPVAMETQPMLLDPARASYLIQLITGVSPFTGNRAELELFLARMDEVQNLVASYRMDEATVRSLKGFMLSRIDIKVLVEIGATSEHDWEGVKDLLKRKYAGARHSLGRTALEMTELRIAPGESYAAFAKRIGGATRLLKRKVQEACIGEEERKWRIFVYEELAAERLERTLPDKIRTWLHVNQVTFDDAIPMVEDLEQDSRESGRERQGRREWTEVMGRPRRTPPREEPAPRRPFTRGPPRRPDPQYGRNKRSADTRERPPPRKPLECWDCGNTGHMARNCPYVYRRAERRSYADATRSYEPMEVNAARIVRRAKEREGTATSSESSGSESTSSGSAGRARGWPRPGERRPGGRKGEDYSRTTGDSKLLRRKAKAE